MEKGATVRASIDVAIPPRAAFEAFVEELTAALGRLGLQLEPGPNGRLTEGEHAVGQVLVWQPDAQIKIEWRQADWEPDEVTEIALRFEAVAEGTRVTVEHLGWGRLVGEASEVTAWFAGEVAGPLLRSMAPSAVGDWLTDRGARRPSGPMARATYRDPVYHRPGFHVLLEMLAPSRDDYLLEVGCGGGAFLKDALQSGCRAAAVDHSPDMVRIARDQNRDALAEGRLEIVEASAERLPFPDATFTCAAMFGVLGFLRDPVAALAEIRRVLARDGRLALAGTDPELKGTLAAPEPFASRLRFYDETDLERLARDAGFAEARVERPEGEHLVDVARAAGVPEEHLSFFTGHAGRYVFARKG